MGWGRVGDGGEKSMIQAIQCMEREERKRTLEEDSTCTVYRTYGPNKERRNIKYLSNSGEEKWECDLCGGRGQE